MQARFSRTFSKQYDRAPFGVCNAFDTRLRIFLQDKFHPFLNNHALTGEWRGHRSFNVTGDWRAVWQEREGGTIAYFVALGTHSQLYS